MVLSELRLLASARFDSQALLCVVLSGDARLLDKLRATTSSRWDPGSAPGSPPAPLPARNYSLASNTCSRPPETPGLMTKELRHLLCDHAAGNYRILIGMAADLLMTAAQTETTVLDEKLYFQVFNSAAANAPRRAAGAR